MKSRPLFVTIVAVVVAVLLAAAAPAPAEERKIYKLVGWSWPNVSSLTACFHEAKPYNHTFAGGRTYRVSRLPDEYRAFLVEAATTWTNTARVPVVIKVVERCAYSDILLAAVDLGGDRGGGMSGCAPTTEGSDKLRTQYSCKPSSGIVALNTKLASAKGNEKGWKAIALQGFGVTLGLNYPVDPPCSNRCYGPIMSAGSCTTVKNCRQAPDENDVAGINMAYYATENPSYGSGGGNCLALSAPGRGSIATPGLVDLTAPTPVQGQSIEFMSGMPADDLFSNPVGAVEGTVDELVDTVRMPGVDTYDTVRGTADKALWTTKTVYDKLGVQDPVGNCLPAAGQVARR